MVVRKIDGLDYGFRSDDRFFIISFLGPVDKVRKAARDAVFGLRLTGGIEAKCEHISEMYKSSYGDENAQIDIGIGLQEFDRLILFFRYCNQIGNNINAADLYKYDNGKTYYYKINETSSGAGTLGAYLATAKKIADANKEPLQMENYPLPTNQNFWFKEELASYAKTELDVYKAKNMQLSLFFKRHPDDAEAKKNIIRFRIDHINQIIEDMVNAHPKNPNNFKASIGWYYLNNYKHLQDHLKQHPDFLTKNPQYFKEQFSLIREQDLEKFKFLAKKYSKLQAQLQALSALKQSTQAIPQFKLGL